MTLNEITTKYRTTRAETKRKSNAAAKAAKTRSEAAQTDSKLFNAEKYKGDGLYFPAWKRVELPEFS